MRFLLGIGDIKSDVLLLRGLDSSYPVCCGDEWVLLAGCAPS